MMNILQIPNKLYLMEHFIQTSDDSMNQAIGSSLPENWRRRGGPLTDGGGGRVEIYKGG